MLLLVDIHNFIYSDFAVAPDHADDLTINRISEFQARFKPDVTVACFDSNKSFRRDLWSPYKADRAEKPAELEGALCTAFARLYKSGVACARCDGFESDDIIATLAKRYKGKVAIMSSDSDLHQVLESGRVVQVKKFRVENIGENRTATFYNVDNMIAEYGFGPSRWVEFSMLVGKTGQWDGCDGIGKKRAQELVNAISLDTLLAEIETIDLPFITDARRVALTEFKQRLPLVRQLATLRIDTPTQVKGV